MVSQSKITLRLVQAIFQKVTGYLVAHKPEPLPVVLEDQPALWLARSGLLPCADYHALITCTNPETHARLMATVLSYRMLGENTLQVYRDVVTNLEFNPDYFIPLKGIDVCQRYYPLPYLRPMRDIDFLIDESDMPAILKHLTRMGFVEKPLSADLFNAPRHHEIPLYNATRQCWIEVHTGLFPPVSISSKTGIFDLAQLCKFSYNNNIVGDPKQRLFTPEFLLIYLAAHWAEDLNFESGCLPLLDIALIIGKEPVHWEKVIQITGKGVVAGYLLIALCMVNIVLPGFVPPNVIQQLQSRAIHLNRLNRSICISFLVRYLLAGRPFSRLTQHSVPSFVEKLLSDHSPWANFARACFSLVAPHHGRVNFITSLKTRFLSLIHS